MRRLLSCTTALTLALLMVCGGAACRKVAKPAKTEGEKAPITEPTETPVTEPAATPAADPDHVAPGTQGAVARGMAYLRQSQLADGGWPATPGESKSNLPVTVVAAHGLLRAGVPGDDPMIEKAIALILKYVKPQGSIFDEGLENYTTCISVMVLKAADEQKHKETIDKAIAFLKTYQWDEGEGLGHESQDFGGTGYGTHQRPDLSNTQWFVETLRDAGLGTDDPAVKKALIFVSRTQAGSEEARFIALPDGGFIYTPHGGGESKAGKEALPSGEEGLKTYGSMTYAGFLSLIYAGLDKDDRRVKAAREWIGKHWTLEENPQLGMEGYYYYLMTMGKALKAYGEPTVKDDKGVAHEWRKELSAKLMALQKDDGSWVNSDPRWWESNPAISTPFALIGLQACLAEL